MTCWIDLRMLRSGRRANEMIGLGCRGIVALVGRCRLVESTYRKENITVVLLKLSIVVLRESRLVVIVGVAVVAVMFKQGCYVFEITFMDVDDRPTTRDSRTIHI